MMPETSVADVAVAAGINPEVITIAVSMVAPKLVSPLAAVAKRWRKTHGPDTRTILKVLTALIVGVGGWVLGLYGYDLRGVANAFMAAFLAYFKAIGQYERDVNVQAKANRVGVNQEQLDPASYPSYPMQPSYPYQQVPMQSYGYGKPQEVPATLHDLEEEWNRQTGLDWQATQATEDPNWRQ